MDPGQLDRRVTLRRRTVTPNALNEAVETFSDLAVVWAQVLALSRRDQFVGEQNLNLSTLRFNIRYRSDFTTVDRVVYRGKEYDVTDVAEVGRKDGLSILGVARSGDG